MAAATSGSTSASSGTWRVGVAVSADDTVRLEFPIYGNRGHGGGGGGGGEKS